MRHHIGEYVSIVRIYHGALRSFIGTLISASTVKCTCRHACLNYGSGWGSLKSEACHGLSEKLKTIYDEMEFCETRFTPDLVLIRFEVAHQNIVNKVTEVE